MDAGSGQAAVRSRLPWIAFLIAVLATFLRGQFVYFPPFNHSDERIVGMLSLRAADTHRISANWSGFPDQDFSRPTYQFSPYTLIENSIALAWRSLFLTPISLEDHMRFARWVSVLFGGLSVWLIFHTARAWYADDRVALVAQLFFAVAFLHVQDSCYARVEAMLSFTILLALWSAAMLLRNPLSLACVIRLGLAIGLVVATKYNAVPIAVLFLACGWSLRRWTIAGAAAAVAFLLATPEVVIDPTPLFAGMRFELAHYADGHIPHQAMDFSDNNLRFWLEYLAMLGLGWVPTVLFVGFLLFGFSHTPRDRLLATYLIACLLVLVIVKVRFERNAELLLGAACMAAARSAVVMVNRVSSNGWIRNVILILLVGMTMVQEGIALIRFRQTQRRDASPLVMIPEEIRTGKYLGFRALEPPPKNWQEAETLLIAGYSDRFSQRSLADWRNRLTGWKLTLLESDWIKHGYPFSTVEVYHGPGFVLVAERHQ